MKAYVSLRTGTLSDLRERIPRLEAWGLTGVMVGDHLFIQAPGQPRGEARRPLEPMTVLATVATLSDRLHIGTMVSNLSFLHPALVLRQFAQLAALFGGERVLAGLELSVERVRSASAAAGRPGTAVSMSVLVGWLEFCRASEVAGVAERICRDNRLPPQSLDDCPYALLGEPAQMVDTLQQRRDRFGLDMVIIAGAIDPQRFCEEVLPHVS